MFSMVVCQQSPVTFEALPVVRYFNFFVYGLLGHGQCLGVCNVEWWSDSKYSIGTGIDGNG
jgi:hypothetical protein